jgi:hypothetical protein
MSGDVYQDTKESAPSIPRGKTSLRAEQINQMRHSPQYKKLRNEFRAACARQRHQDGSTGEPCWLCNGTIDYQLKHPHPYAFTLDHAITVKENPDMMMDPLNFRAAHSDCNLGRGTDDPPIDLGVPSEVW